MDEPHQSRKNYGEGAICFTPSVEQPHYDRYCSGCTRDLQMAVFAKPSDASGGLWVSLPLTVIGYPLHSSSAGGWLDSALPTMASYVAGPMATAWQASLWKSKPLAFDRRRLNRKANSSR
jgi:hypothetical protein